MSIKSRIKKLEKIRGSKQHIIFYDYQKKTREQAIEDYSEQILPGDELYIMGHPTINKPEDSGT